MSSMSASEWARYRDILEKLSREAADEFRDAVWKVGGRWNGVGLSKIPRDELISYAYALIAKYGEGSAAVACQLYDEIASLSGVIVPPAVPAEIPTIREVAKVVTGTIYASGNENVVCGAVGRLVKQVGQDTTIQNAIRDGAEVAWIPAGDTCAFCLALASRGWESASKTIIKNGHAAHIHANCDCAYGVRFDSAFSVGGYDPERYLAMYKGAEGDTPTEKINSMRRQFYAENSEEINEQKRSAYSKRIERESSRAEEFNVGN